MEIKFSRGLAAIAALVLLALCAGPACGQEYPNRIIKIITAAAGGGSDFIARILAQGIAGPLGQQIVIDNKGTGVLAGEAAVKAPPDGYTLTVQGGAFWIGPLLRKTVYDPVKDFLPISLIVREVNILAVHPAVPAQSVQELIAYAKANPGKLNYSSPGVGSTTQLASELLKAMAGVNIVHVPYQGNQPAISAMMGGEVQMAIFDAGLIAPQVKAGRLRALAVTSLEPTALAPGLPTMAASGLPGYESIGMTGIFAVGDKTPRPIIARLNQEILKFLAKPEIKDQFLKSGVEMVGSTPEQFAEAIRADVAKMGKLIKDIGLRVE
ncbi:MAG: tripartite tricarboxylate transporter substrate binding protein [Betaproteobacteria bacterium]|nr:tripartite tricarboxylate transporter substrate binding protein [Betaproteobacteria bacterium]